MKHVWWQCLKGDEVCNEGAAKQADVRGQVEEVIKVSPSRSAVCSGGQHCGLRRWRESSAIEESCSRLIRRVKGDIIERHECPMP